MQIQEVAIASVIPYINNPRLNDAAVSSVKASIAEFGFKVPLVVDSKMVVITGHTRLKAAIELGLKSVPIIVADDLSEEQVKAYRLADNRTGENATWDSTLLEQELQVLRSMGFDLSTTGFTVDELDCLLDPLTADCLDDLDVVL